MCLPNSICFASLLAEIFCTLCFDFHIVTPWRHQYLICIIQIIILNISGTRWDMTKRKTPFFFTFKGLSNSPIFQDLNFSFHRHFKKQDKLHFRNNNLSRIQQHIALFLNSQNTNKMTAFQLHFIIHFTCYYPHSSKNLHGHYFIDFIIPLTPFIGIPCWHAKLCFIFATSVTRKHNSCCQPSQNLTLIIFFIFKVMSFH